MRGTSGVVGVMVGCALAGIAAVGCVSSSSTNPAPSFDGGQLDGAFDSGATHDAGADTNEPADAADAAPPVPTTITFASGPDWPSSDGDLSGSDGGALGPAQPVCVTASVPPNCPSSGVIYRPGTTGSGWTANVGNAGAQWIWRGDVGPTKAADLQYAIFQKTFTLGANPTGTISVAADDYVEVLVNGTPAGNSGSVTTQADAYAAQTTAKALVLTSLLKPGANTITVVGQNGPASFVPCTGGCTYAQNTAGVVFAGSLTSE